MQDFRSNSIAAEYQRNGAAYYKLVQKMIERLPEVDPQYRASHINLIHLTRCEMRMQYKFARSLMGID